MPKEVSSAIKLIKPRMLESLAKRSKYSWLNFWISNLFNKGVKLSVFKLNQSNYKASSVYMTNQG